MKNLKRLLNNLKAEIKVRNLWFKNCKKKLISKINKRKTSKKEWQQL